MTDLLSLNTCVVCGEPILYRNTPETATVLYVEYSLIVKAPVPMDTVSVKAVMTIKQ